MLESNPESQTSQADAEENASATENDNANKTPKNMKNPIWFIFWLVVLIIVAFPVAFFCAGWYILIYPLTVCIPDLSGVTDLLLKGVQLTHYTAKAMMECQSLC